MALNSEHTFCINISETICPAEMKFNYLSINSVYVLVDVMDFLCTVLLIYTIADIYIRVYIGNRVTAHIYIYMYIYI